MRAQCEGCGKPQPPDWKAGDLCSFCGKAVRHDVRCYWCAKWVPAAKFCRSCGAAVVEERLYGAARMLKDAGTDRFTIPKQLKEFDPDQIENFSRIYQRHAIASRATSTKSGSSRSSSTRSTGAPSSRTADPAAAVERGDARAHVRPAHPARATTWRP
jgi:hypothetical protein